MTTVHSPHLTFPLQPLERPYLRVSGEATVRHVALFIRRKMELSSTCQVSAATAAAGQKGLDSGQRNNFKGGMPALDSCDPDPSQE